MIKFKSCPKCANGDLVLGRDIYGWYMQCIQCAQMLDMVPAPTKDELPKLADSIVRTAA